MMSLKIQCGCGQKYAFDVEPANGAMPYTVACPVCGADGTPAANAAIAQAQPAAPVMAAAPLRATAPSFAAAPATPLRAAAPAQAGRVVSNSVPRRSAIAAKEIDYTQVEAETRARVLWGDSREEAIKFAALQGLTMAEAAQLVDPMMAERYATIRKNGVMKIIFGAIMACVPIPGWLYLAMIDIKLFAVTAMVGLYGGYQFLKGIMMVVSPKTEAGNVAEQ
jgi:hypothetical protein